jgi:hypothetical protein
VPNVPSTAEPEAFRIVFILFYSELKNLGCKFLILNSSELKLSDEHRKKKFERSRKLRTVIEVIGNSSIKRIVFYWL